MESRGCPEHVGKDELKLPGRRGGMTSATPKRTLAGGNEEALLSVREHHREAVVPRVECAGFVRSRRSLFLLMHTLMRQRP
jgi:hypothetical protein